MMDFLISLVKFLFGYFVGMSIMFQYGIVIKMFFQDEWETRKEFLMHLIPFYPQGYLIKDFVIDIKDEARKAWKKLK